MKSVLDVAEKGVITIHKTYGEIVRLMKYMPSATGGIYKQRKRLYEAPYEILAKVNRDPNPEQISKIGESSERNAHITLPVRFLIDLFGNSTPVKETITSSDLIVFDNRVWRITTCAFTGRIGDRPLIVELELREKLGEKESDYYGRS